MSNREYFNKVSCVYENQRIAVRSGIMAAMSQFYSGKTLQISIFGVLWLSRLYNYIICIGLYGKFVWTTANRNVKPIIRFLGHGRGRNKVLIYSLVLITLVVLLFVLDGDLNTLAPIVTTAFRMLYAAVNSAYFTLAMSYDRRQARGLRRKPTLV